MSPEGNKTSWASYAGKDTSVHKSLLTTVHPCREHSVSARARVCACVCVRVCVRDSAFLTVLAQFLFCFAKQPSAKFFCRATLSQQVQPFCFCKEKKTYFCSTLKCPSSPLKNQNVLCFCSDR